MGPADRGLHAGGRARRRGGVAGADPVAGDGEGELVGAGDPGGDVLAQRQHRVVVAVGRVDAVLRGGAAGHRRRGRDGAGVGVDLGQDARGRGVVGDVEVAVGVERRAVVGRAGGDVGHDGGREGRGARGGGDRLVDQGQLALAGRAARAQDVEPALAVERDVAVGRRRVQPGDRADASDAGVRRGVERVEVEAAVRVGVGEVVVAVHRVDGPTDAGRTRGGGRSAVEQRRRAGGRVVAEHPDLGAAGEVLVDRVGERAAGRDRPARCSRWSAPSSS